MKTLIAKSRMIVGVALGLSFSALSLAESAAVNLKGELIVNPPCELTASNGDGVMELDFGDLVIRKISTATSGRAYRQTIPFKLVCDAPDDTGVYIFVSSERGAPFDNRLVATSNDNVGLMFINNNGLVTRLGNPAGMLVGSQTSWKWCRYVTRAVM
ncbi:hypothetical protein A3Q29_12070 [Providencia stuartii]|uniref:Uncharacterized protein n=1 Tax=Providencia stuartii TaxID=588 RepID=A0A1S1HTQ6_PROST|nr:hypothetical protein A3Q29_12070 [Providencia stuartii]